MSELVFEMRGHRGWWGLRLVTVHVLITLLAVGIAFALPVAAQYILYQWWPRVAADANLLLASEMSLAASLVLVFNMWRAASENRLKGRAADTAALVYARRRASWLTRLRERSLIRKLPAARDAFILTLTGYDTFADRKSLLHRPLQSAYEIRVMLLNPAARGAEKRIQSLPLPITQQSYVEEVEASIAYLAALRALGKQVSLKFYDHEPFWKLVVLGGHLWVQYCHSGFEVKADPEYVFALNPENPRLGLFVPFYMYFLGQWSDPRHPRYDFDTGELVYGDGHGREFRRTRLAGGRAPTPALLDPRPAAPASAGTGGQDENRKLETEV
ncbi:MAG: hypothetical protein HYY78_11615 [Betaproteobacteria bacterium]|nr:hypothetical protein [Betaproteobacteria bacterium]